MKGAVAAGDRLTAEAATEALLSGGNAFDAAVAAAFTAPIAEPALTSAGGGGFLLAISQDSPPVLYDFFVDVPPKRKKELEFYPITVDFGDTTQVFHIGMGSVAVPGFVAGLLELHRERGKIPLRELLSIAARHAKEGVYLSPIQASFVKLLEPIFTATEEARKIYAPDGKLIDETRPFKNPDYADFLEALAAEGASLFYEGEVAKKIEKLSEERGGLITCQELKRYKTFERKPLSFSFRGRQIYTNPPPSSGGILIAFTLLLLEGRELGSWGSQNHVSALIEALRLTGEFRKEELSKVPIHSLKGEELLTPLLLERYRAYLEEALKFWGSTTHLCILDAEGNGVSMTTTNGEGSGVVIPGTGVMLNNMLGEEDLNPHGFFSWPGGVRLPSMMSPTAVLEDGKVSLLLGSAGSNRIRSAIVNVILNFLVFEKEPQEAVSLPRIHFESGTVYAEPGYSQEVLREVEKRYKLLIFREKSMFFGGVQAVSGSLGGAGDPRRGGVFVKI